MKNLLYLIIPIIVFNCETRKEKVNEYQFLDNKDSLAVYVRNIPFSKDTIFLGFRMGMTEEEYKGHIDKLRKEGKTIKYDKNLKKDALKKLFGKGYKLNGLYRYGTVISKEESSKTITGTGEFVFIPLFNKKEGLVTLNVITKYDWDETVLFSMDTSEDWLYENSLNSYVEVTSWGDERNLYDYLYSQGLKHISVNKMLLKNNVILQYQIVGFYQYQNKRTVFSKILLDKVYSEKVEEATEEITF